MFMDPRRLLSVVPVRTTVSGLLTGLALSWSAAPVQAQPVEVSGDLPIDAVTVYAGSVSVARSGGVDIPAGASTLVPEDLPGGLNPALLQLAIADAGVRFSHLQIQENYREEAGNARERELREQLQTLRDQRPAVDRR